MTGGIWRRRGRLRGAACHKSFAEGEVSKEITVVTRSKCQSPESVSVVATCGRRFHTIGGQAGPPSSSTPRTLPSGTGLLARYWDTASSTCRDARTSQVGRITSRDASRRLAQSSSLPTGNLPLRWVIGKAISLGQLNNALQSLTLQVTAVSASSFTVGISAAAALPASGTGNCSFSIQSFLHPPVVERVDPTVNFDWQYGTPNGVVILPNNNADNYSAVWEAYLHPTTAGAYQFQLDADDKARVFLDLNDGNGLVQIVEHGWDTPATVGTFKQSTAYNPWSATPANRYKIRIEHVETIGAHVAACSGGRAPGLCNIPRRTFLTHTQAATYDLRGPAPPMVPLRSPQSWSINGDTVTPRVLREQSFSRRRATAGHLLWLTRRKIVTVAIVGTNLLPMSQQAKVASRCDRRARPPAPICA